MVGLAGAIAERLSRPRAMEQQAFDEIHAAENSWWYHTRIFAIQKVLKRFKVRRARICDIGAGYGGMCPALKPFLVIRQLSSRMHKREQSAPPEASAIPSFHQVTLKKWFERKQDVSHWCHFLKLLNMWRMMSLF